MMTLHKPSINMLRPLFKDMTVRVGVALVVAVWLFNLFSRLIGIHINTTASLPIGLYIETSKPTDYVTFCMDDKFSALAKEHHYVPDGPCPHQTSPLIKEITARPGDIVFVSHDGIGIDTSRPLPNTKPLKFDSHHQPLVGWPIGKYVVKDNTYWVLSTYDHRSLDSRYYGPIHSTQIRSHLLPFLTFH